MASQDYEKVPLSEYEDSSSEEGDKRLLSQTRLAAVARRPYLYYLMYCVVGSVIFALGVAVGSWRYRNLSRLCFEMHSTYTPGLDEIDTRYHEVRFNGSIVMESPFRGEPRPELDDAWQELEEFQITRITDEEYASIPYPLESVRAPEEAGGGWMASLDNIHFLHCLNFMRKSSAWNFDYYKTRSLEYADSPVMLHHHFDHCADMLRQNLMCNADVSLLPYRWVKGFDGPQIDFNSLHKCRNYESIKQWTVKREMTMLTGIPKPHPGEKIWDTLP